MKVMLSAVAMYLMFLQTPERIPRLLSESEDVASKEVRAARAGIWDFGGRGPEGKLDASPRPLPPGVPPPPYGVSTSIDLIPTPELPIETSEIVAVAEVINVQPFLSTNRGSMYTEYTIRILESVKPREQAKETVVIMGMGGKARLEDGRIIHHQVDGLGDPLLAGQRYLVFLSPMANLDLYGAQSMWHVEGNVIKAVYPIHKARPGQFQPTDGKPLADVLSFLRSKLEE